MNHLLNLWPAKAAKSWQTDNGQGGTQRPTAASLRAILLVFCVVSAAFTARAQNVTASVAAQTQPAAVAVNPLTNFTYVVNTGSNSVTVVNGLTNAATNLTVGTQPVAVAVNPVTNQIYVANQGSANVSVIAGATQTTAASVANTITVGTTPVAVAVNPVTNKIYVANKGTGTVTAIDATGNTTATITVGTQPVALAVNPVTNEVYVANFQTNNVTIINAASNNSTSPVTVGTGPAAVAVNPVTNQIFVANATAGTVTVMSGSGSIAATPTVGSSPNSIDVNPVTNKIYVANAGSANVSVIDGTNLSGTPTTLSTGGGSTPFAVSVNPVTNQVYVATKGTNNVIVINGATGIAAATVSTTLNAGTNPTAVAVNPVTDKIYVANNGASSITVIDGAVNAFTSVTTGGQPLAVAVNPVTNKIYYANSTGNSVTVIDGTGVLAAATVPAAGSPIAIAVNPVTNFVYVVNNGNKTVTAFNAAITPYAPVTINVGNQPNAIAVNPVTGMIYVSNYQDGTVSVISGTAVVGTVGVAPHPQAIAVNPVTNETYVACASGAVAIINGAGVASQVLVGHNPISVAVNPVTNKIYASNYDDGTVTAIDGSTHTAIATITVGTSPLSLAVNPVTNKVYVANQGSNSVTVIDANNGNATSPVTAGGAPWYVAVNPATNKIYVANAATIGQFTSTLTVIDGSSNSTSTISTLNQQQPVFIAVNPVTNQVWVANQFGNNGSGNGTVVTEQPVQSIGITATTQALSGNQTTSLTPAFNFTTANTFTNGSPLDGVLYQVDTWEGAWQFAQHSSGFSATVATLQPGYHILYTFGADGEEGSTTVAGLSGSPLIGTINSYGFLVAPTGATLAPSSLNFGSVEATQPGTPQSATLTNGGATTLTFTISNTDATEFPESGSDTCSTAGGQLAPGASCSISINFTPQLPTGAKSATLTVTDNSNGIAGSTQTITLSGTATGNVDPGVVWNPSPSTITYPTALGPGQLNATATAAGTFVYTPATGTILGAGTRTLSVTFTPTDPNTYSGTTKTVQITVSKAPLTVTATSIKAPFGQTPAYTATYSPFVNGDTSAVVTGAPTFTLNTSTTPIPVGTWTITPSIGTLTAANYQFSNFSAGTLTVQAVPTVTVTANPSSGVLYGQSVTISATLSGITGSATGTVSFYQAASGATCSALGASTLLSTQNVSSNAASFSTSALTAGSLTVLGCYSGDNSFYASAGSTNMTVGQAIPVITWPAPTAINYGTALSSVQLNATTVPAGTFTYNPPAGSVLGAGTQTLSVQFVPTDTKDYTTATKQVPLTVNQAPANSQATVTGTLNGGTQPKAVVVNPLTNTMYVANFGASSVSIINGATNAIATVTVGRQPAALAIDPVTNKIYVANYQDGTISVIDGATNAVSSPITVGTSPTVVAVNNVTNQVFVVNSGTNNVSVLSGAFGSTAASLLNTIPVGTNPYAVAINPITNLVYVTNQGSNTVSVINGANPTVVSATVNVGSNPYAISVNPVANKIYVTDLNGGQVSVIDPTNSNAVTPVTVGNQPWAVVVNPVSNKAYVANYGSATVTVIDGASNYSTSPVTVGTNPNALAFNAITNQIYVANLGSNNFTVIDGASNTATNVAVGTSPDAVAVNPVTDKIYFANNGSNNISVVDGATNTTVATGTGTYPTAIAVNPATNTVYVANNFSNDVTIITPSQTSTVTVGSFPSAVAVNPATNQIYVVNSNNVSIVNGATKAVTPLTVGNQPSAVAVNVVTNKIYVTNYVDASVSVIDGGTNTVTGVVSVGIHPDAIAVNPVTNKIYVACLGGGGTVTVIDGATNTPSQPILAGDWPLAIAVNPATNKIYVANSNLDSYPTPGSVTVIDGTTNTPTNINAGVEPFAIAVNPLTNQIYAANKDGNSILVINGATNATTTLSVGVAPFAIAVNPVSNKIYVPNAGAVSGSYYISVIDGATNNIETLSAGSQPAAAAVNPMNNQIYIANQVSNNLTTLIEQQVQTIQIVSTITPLSGNATTSSSPTFHFTTANNFTTGAPINNLVYQVDTWTGSWTAATSNGSGNFSGNASSLQPGYHIIYSYATEGEEGTSGAGPEGSAVIGNIAAYGFLVTGGSSSGANVSPNGINFGGQVKLLPSSAQTVTLSNSSNSVLTFSIAISGTNAGDFAEPSTSPDTCTALAGQLAANTSCNIAVIFTPQATGARSATLTVTDSLNGGQNQNQTVSLSGIGTGNQIATLAWTPGNIPYGSTAASVPSPTATYQSSNVPGTFAFTPSLNTLAVGNPSVSVTFTPTDPTNFASVTQNFSVTVIKATLTVSATSATRVYGLANPAFVGSYTGFVNGDTAATALSGAPSFSTTATATSSVGNYPITVTQGTLAATNYSFVFTAGNLAVTQATTTVSWGPLAPMTAGAALGATQLSATATSSGATVPGTFTYNPPAGTVLATGTQTLSATFAPAADGNGIVDYTTPAAATVTVQVNQAQAIAGTNDTATQGNWIGVYGGDGYYLAPTTTSLPSYATVQVQNQTNFTWISPTTDARALLDASGSTRTAAAWYAITSYNFDINITDGQSHPLAFYVVDWDSIGRAETITLTDAVTHATLSTQSISNFGNGAYLKWTVSGHITVTVTATSGNAVVSGLFFGGSSGTESVTVAPHSITLSGGGTQQFAATIHNASPQSFTWAIQSVNPVGAAQGTLSTTGLYTAPATITTAATVTVAATSADGLATGTATVSLTTGSGGTGTGGNTASFATSDSTTGGTWIGVYGGDGRMIANVTPASLPSYASVTVGNQANYTWAATTSDPRALETGLGNARIASTWYSQSSFTVDVNVTDGNAHQVALYGVDWDGQGRSETIQVADGTTGAQLDSRTLTNFGNGTYMVWNISGHVKFTITKQIGSNSVLSGIFFAPSSGGTGGGGTETVTVTPNSTTLAGGGTQQMGATVTNASSQTVTWSITAVNPTGAAQGTISTAGLYSAPATITTAATVAITATSADGTATGTGSITLTAGSGGGTGTGGTAVAFVKSDTTTSGTWMGVYGGDGFQISNVTPASLPSYATMTLQNAASYSWAQNTTDTRALQTGSGTNRLPSAFYSNAGFYLDLNLTDGNTHQVAFYAVDWDLSGRTEKLQITDAVSGNQLDSQTISGFNNGVWLVWNISGHIHINVSGSAGPNALLSGVFFAPGGGTTGGGGTEKVTVTPNSTALSSGGTQQMSATVTNASSQTVTWSITAVNPTGAAQGTIASTGLYTAPATITTGATVTITATSADGTATGTASITLNAGSGGTGTGGNSVAFVKLDTTTGGTWIGVYGGDGRAVANVTPTSLPSYASVTVGSQANYTWEGTTSDPRALETGLGNARIASTWYSQTSFTVDVNITDSNTHQVALYGVDWDGEGRSEMIQVADGTTGAQLDSRTLTNFLNGTYVIYNVSGHVKFTITKQVGANSVISGIFFAPSSGGTGGGGTETVTVTPPSTTLAGGGTQQMGATVTNASSQTVTWSITAVNPTGAAQGTISTTGLYTAPATITTAATVTITATSADGTATGTGSITLTAGSGGGTGTGGTTVAFVKSDTTTSGTWIGVYGGDGKQIANITPASLPSYATMTVQNAASYSWLQSTSDPRALETGSGNNRLPSAFYSNAGFYVDLNLTDGNTHQVAFYVVDWDMSGRTEKLQITDAVSGSQLDSQTISGFNNGVWLVWNISGHVHINVTGSAGPNALLSGIFFDPVPGGGAEAVTVTPNSTTLAGGATQQMNATVTNGPNQTVTWSITAVNPSGAAQGTISSTGLYSAPATITTTAAVTITATSSDGTATGTATINLSAGGTGTAGTAVAFVKKDTTTQGTWLGVYGTSGKAVANVTPSSIPSFASFSVQNQANYTWDTATTDPRAPETGLGNARIASAWYSNSSFYIDLNFTDGNTHQFSIYAVDWDLGGRTEQIQVVDAVSGTPLNTQTLSSFTNGAYLVWNISGHVKIVATPQVGANALINGAFFQ